MLKSERIGYGYERGDRSFKPHKCAVIFLDDKSTHRSARIDLMERLRAGDTLVIFSWKELAPGALKSTMEAQLDGMGVAVELVDQPTPAPVQPTQRGMTDEAKAEALPMWHQPAKFSVEYIQNHVAQKGLGTWTRNQLNYALGPRSV